MGVASKNPGYGPKVRSSDNSSKVEIPRDHVETTYNANYCVEFRTKTQALLLSISSFMVIINDILLDIVIAFS